MQDTNFGKEYSTTTMSFLNKEEPIMDKREDDPPKPKKTKINYTTEEVDGYIKFWQNTMNKENPKKSNEKQYMDFMRSRVAQGIGFERTFSGIKTKLKKEIEKSGLDVKTKKKLTKKAPRTNNTVLKVVKENTIKLNQILNILTSK